MTRTFPLAASGLVALALAGCASTHGLAPAQQLDDPARLPVQQTLTVPLSDAAWPSEDWWRRLHDPQLDRLVAAALADSPDLDVMDARLRAARARAMGADAARDLEGSLSLRADGASLPETLAPAPIGGHFDITGLALARLSWSPDPWGGQRAAFEAAVGRARAAEIDARAARATLAVDVVATYARLAQAYGDLDVAAAELARAERFLDLTQQRVDAGVDSRLQLRQAQAEVPAARRARVAAQLQVDRLGLTLAALVGAPPDRAQTLQRPATLDFGALTLPSQLPAELLGRRADLVAARWRAEAAGHDIDVATARFYPNVNLAAFAGLAVQQVDQLFEDESQFYGGGPALSLPIFAGERLRASLDEADAAFDAAVADYNARIVGALHDVADSVTAWRSVDRQLEEQAQALEAARDAHRLALLRYEQGVGSYLEALAAQRPLLAAEQTYNALLGQRLAAAVQLIDALGGGFPPAASAQLARQGNP